MSIALPSGWVDTGKTTSITMSGKVRILMAMTAPAGLSDRWGAIGGWRVKDNSFGSGTGCPPGQAEGWWEAILINPYGGAITTLETTSTGGCVTPSQRWSNDYEYHETWGPFRLGVRYSVRAGHENDQPVFAQGCELTYRWFADRNTSRDITMADQSHMLWLQASGMYGEEQEPSEFTPVISGQIGQLVWEVHPVGGANEVSVSLTELTIGGVLVDTSDLDFPNLIGRGGGAADGIGTGGTGADAFAPYQVEHDVRILKNWTERSQEADPGGVGALLNSALFGNVTAPHTGSYVGQVLSWRAPPATAEDITIDEDWAAAQDPPWRHDDRQVLIWGQPALSNPSEGGATYSPATLDVEPEQDLGIGTWTGSGGMTVTPGSGQVTFNGAGGTAARTLAESWRAHVAAGFGTGNVGEMVKYEDTRHETGDDIWFWGLYAYLRLTIEFPEDAGPLTLQIEGVHLQVNDTHETGSARSTNSTASEIAYSYGYRVAPDAEGGTVCHVDLLMPTELAPGEQVPVYLSRVDTLTLTDFDEGDYVLSELALSWQFPLSVEDAYLKLDFGPPVPRDDYSAAGLALGGTHAYGNWQDQQCKPDEIGQVGGNPRFVNIITGATEGDVQDNQFSLVDYVNLLQYLEGVVTHYDVEAFEAANKDAYGNALSGEIAQWLRPIVPFVRVHPGDSYSLAAAPHAGRVVYANGYPFKCYVRDPKGYGGIEGVVVQLSTQVRPPAIPIEAYRVDTGETVAVDLPDTCGYTVLTPVPGRRPESELEFGVRPEA